MCWPVALLLSILNLPLKVFLLQSSGTKGFMFNLIDAFCILKRILRNSNLQTFENHLIKFLRNCEVLHLELFNLLLKISYDKSFKYKKERIISGGVHAFFFLLLFLGLKGTDPSFISFLQFVLLLSREFIPSWSISGKIKECRNCSY